MTDSVVIAVVSLAGTLAGTFGGIITSSKLTSYRLGQLEKRVDDFSSSADKISVLENRIKVCENRVSDMAKREERDT